MIVAIETLMQMNEFSKINLFDLKMRIESLEEQIRKYTNNNFQNRKIRFNARSDGNQIFGSSLYIKKGDTIQISDSCVNDGIYTVNTIDNEVITVDQELYSADSNLITKVEYSKDIVSGVVEMLKWDLKNKSKTGLKSESLSRYSVAYEDDSTKIMGYPKSLVEFLNPYMKARF